MAKTKPKTTKEITKKVGKKAAKSVQQSIDLIEKMEEPKRCLEVGDIDNEMKEVIKAMGEVQTKYQQLGVTVKGNVVRSTIKSLRTRYKEWK